LTNKDRLQQTCEHFRWSSIYCKSSA